MDGRLTKRLLREENLLHKKVAALNADLQFHTTEAGRLPTEIKKNDEQLVKVKSLLQLKSPIPGGKRLAQLLEQEENELDQKVSDLNKKLVESKAEIDPVGVESLPSKITRINTELAAVQALLPQPRANGEKLRKTLEDLKRVWPPSQKAMGIIGIVALIAAILLVILRPY